MRRAVVCEQVVLGKVVAAMNFSGLASRVTLETMLEDFRPRLLSTARTISESAGSLPWT